MTKHSSPPRKASHHQRTTKALRWCRAALSRTVLFVSAHATFLVGKRLEKLRADDELAFQHAVAAAADDYMGGEGYCASRTLPSSTSMTISSPASPRLRTAGKSCRASSNVIVVMERECQIPGLLNSSLRNACAGRRCGNQTTEVAAWQHDCSGPRAAVASTPLARRNYIHLRTSPWPLRPFVTVMSGSARYDA